MIDSLWQDVRRAVRGYLKTPLFTIAVLLILGLGIGANSAIFSIVNTVILRPLAYPDSAALVSVTQGDRVSGVDTAVSPPNYFDLVDQSRTLSGAAAYWSPSVSLSGGGAEPEKVLAATCSYNLFGVLGVTAHLGRMLRAEDDVPGAPRVAVLGYGMWQRRFGGDPGIVGRDVLLDGNPVLVVGVMPAGFAFPAAGTELWMPLRISRTQPPNPAIRADAYRQYRILKVVARLRDGATLAQARADAVSIARQLEMQFPRANANLSVTVTPLHDVVVGEVRPALLLLLACVICVLLIACANVGGLLLVRAASRQREVTIQLALGADRLRLVRQMLTESVVLALAGGAVAMVFSAWALELLVRVAPAGIPRLADVRLDGTAIAFTLATAVCAGLLFGTAPAMQVRASRLQQALLAVGRSNVSGSHQRVRQGLVVAEIALSLMLLIGAGLLIQSLVRMARVNPGFRASSVLTFDRIELPRGRAAAPSSAAFFEELLVRLRAVPGIESAAVTLGLPLDPRARFFVDETPFDVEGRPVAAAQRPAAPLHVISPDYFATLGVPLIEGRWFTDRDRAASPGVVIINDAMARQLWPGQSAIGRRITHELSIVPNQITTREIVGVVGNVRHFGIDARAGPQMFIPHAQMPWPAMALVIRTPLDPQQVAASVRQAVWSADPTIPIPPPRAMAAMFADAIAPSSFRAWLLGVFASMALVLAATGLYGTMAYAAQQRTREIGLRIALGASPRAATSLLVKSGLRLAALGIAIGWGGALLASRLLATMLYGVETLDPATFIGVPVLLAAVACVACYVPARQAGGIDPIRAINADR